MSLHFARVGLHGLLVVALLAANLVTPARLMQAAVASLHAHEVVDVAAVDMPPCHAPAERPPVPKSPCDNCTPATCELAGCLASACLPKHAPLLAQLPAQGALPSGDVLAPSSRIVAPPLRPPIA
jgi:hypothetical protein